MRIEPKVKLAQPIPGIPGSVTAVTFFFDKYSVLS